MFALSLTGLWPHYHHVTHAMWKPMGETLRQFALHRGLDLLGALCLVDHERLPSGRFYSHRGGHQTDVGWLKMLESAPNSLAMECL